MSAPQAVEDYSAGYAAGYLEALEHVQDYISDEDAFWAKDGSDMTIFLHHMSDIINAWIDEWR